MSDPMQGPPPQPPQPPSQTPPPPPGEPPSRPDPLPYEEGRGPWLNGLWECFKLFLTDPKQAYSRMFPESALGSALVYAVILGWIGAFFGALWGSLMPGSLGTLPGMEQFDLPAGGGFFAFIGQLVLAPVLFGLVGWWLDQRVGSTPWLTVLFALLGVVGAIVKVYYDFKRGMARAREQAAEYRARRDQMLGDLEHPDALRRGVEQGRAT